MLTSYIGLTSGRAVHLAFTVTMSLKVFKFLIYSGLTNSRAICSHPFLRLTRGRVVRLSITVIKSLKSFQVPNLKRVNERPCRMLTFYLEVN